MITAKTEFLRFSDFKVGDVVTYKYRENEKFVIEELLFHTTIKEILIPTPYKKNYARIGNEHTLIFTAIDNLTKV